MEDTRRKIAMKWICATVVVLIWAVAVDFFGYRDYRYFDEIMDSAPELSYLELVFGMYWPNILGAIGIGVLSTMFATKLRSKVRVRVVVLAIVLLGTPLTILGNYICDLEQERLWETVSNQPNFISTINGEEIDVKSVNGHQEESITISNFYEEFVFGWPIYFTTWALVATGIFGIFIDERLRLKQRLLKAGRDGSSDEEITSFESSVGTAEPTEQTTPNRISGTGIAKFLPAWVFQYETRRIIAVKWLIATVVIFFWSIAVDGFQYYSLFRDRASMDFGGWPHWYRFYDLVCQSSLRGIIAVGIFSTVLATKMRAKVRLRVVVVAIVLLGTPLSMMGNYIFHIERVRLKDTVYKYPVYDTINGEKVDVKTINGIKAYKVCSPNNFYEQMVFHDYIYLTTLAFFAAGFIGIFIDERLRTRRELTQSFRL